MTAIGIDSHKATLAACAVDELGAPLEERTFADDVGHRLVRHAHGFAPGSAAPLGFGTGSLLTSAG